MTSVNYSKQNTAFCLELDRIKLLLEKLGNPDKDFFVIHVAGTNGKGSVCAFLETGLISMGKRCGLFVSPELFSVEDSIRVSGKAIDANILKKILRELSKHSDAVESELGKAPSPFEMLFAAALVHFKKEKCTHVVIECGMGGKGDATNAIGHSNICVFSRIGIDHTGYLGNTLEEITENKCGIIKKGSAVVSAGQELCSEKIIIEKCREIGSELAFAEEFRISRMDRFNPVVCARFGEVRLSLSGCHQAKNASVAATVLYQLGASDKNLVHAFTQTTHRARFEEIERGIYFDGAHNPDGVRSLVNTLNSAGISEKINFVVGFMADKDISGCLDELKNLNNKDIEFFTATVESNPRSESADRLKLMIEETGFTATECKNVKDAVKTATENDGIVFVFGSLYMYKELLGGGKGI